MYSNVSDETLIHIARVLGGEEGVEIIKALKEVEDTTVEDLSSKTEVQINTVRKLLYRFYNHSIVTSRRFRDRDTGWFIFQWRLQPELIEAFVKGMKQKILRKLKTRLEHEIRHEFYHCGSSTCPKVTFEDAMETVFHCPVCKGPLKPFDNSAALRFLKQKIAEIEEELNG